MTLLNFVICNRQLARAMFQFKMNVIENNFHTLDIERSRL